MRTWLTLGLAVGLAACSGSDGAGGGGSFEPIGGPAETTAHAATVDQLMALAHGSVTADRFGDVAGYVASEATAPTNAEHLASVYYETDGFQAWVEATADTRPGREARSDAGARVGQAISTAFTLGSASSADGRNGPAWHAKVVRRLDEVMLLRVSKDLGERSAEAFDRALGLLVDAEGTPHGLGKRIADADAACNTGYYGAMAGALAGARGPFMAALDRHGLPDALDRVRIDAGQSPEYDAALIVADKALVQGLGTAALALLEQPMNSAVQAELLAALEGLAPDMALAESHTCLTDPPEADAVDAVFRVLDVEPSEVDVPQVRCLIQQTLEIAPCGG